jgi:hypothetical protein
VQFIHLIPSGSSRQDQEKIWSYETKKSPVRIRPWIISFVPFPHICVLSKATKTRLAIMVSGNDPDGADSGLIRKQNRE